ncbi:hypothetical protein PCYB_006660 [Plasmodium cynomolgi strain B]|uniref:Uncharacterized protein n=1 Tax=Plasmodium cynomolgi (strain B) TaxID=1120755 RepID=K6VKE9_PLACD|nr:hypothetical protein PCYB_006660 [Plasmodium cynomolgi strain B]GAB69917.1 hypothetical protein PCYB_006660 [Plasmodium cynomolgi strain B]
MNIVHIYIIGCTLIQKRAPIKISICSYDSYNKLKVILESNDLVKLSYFKFNIDYIKNILKEKENPNYCLCHEYLEECVNTYKNMNSSSCSFYFLEDNNDVLCSELKKFNSYYSDLISDITLGEKLPNIDTGIRKVKLLDCQPTSESVSDVKTLPTALGTIAGASSILAFMDKYKNTREI